MKERNIILHILIRIFRPFCFKTEPEWISNLHRFAFIFFSSVLISIAIVSFEGLNEEIVSFEGLNEEFEMFTSVSELFTMLGVLVIWVYIHGMVLLRSDSYAFFLGIIATIAAVAGNLDAMSYTIVAYLVFFFANGVYLADSQRKQRKKTYPPRRRWPWKAPVIRRPKGREYIKVSAENL